MSPITFRVRELREARGLSQEQLAEAAGVRQATISELERRKGGRVNLDLLERIAAALGVEPPDLIVGEVERRGRR